MNEQKLYRETFSALRAPEGLAERTLERAQDGRRTARRLRPGLAAAAVCLCLVLAGTAYASVQSGLWARLERADDENKGYILVDENGDPEEYYAIYRLGGQVEKLPLEELSQAVLDDAAAVAASGEIVSDPIGFDSWEALTEYLGLDLAWNPELEGKLDNTGHFVIQDDQEVPAPLCSVYLTVQESSLTEIRATACIGEDGVFRGDLTALAMTDRSDLSPEEGGRWGWQFRTEEEAEGITTEDHTTAAGFPAKLMYGKEGGVQAAAFVRKGVFYVLNLYHSGTPELLKTLLDGFQ